MPLHRPDPPRGIARGAPIMAFNPGTRRATPRAYGRGRCRFGPNGDRRLLTAEAENSHRGIFAYTETGHAITIRAGSGLLSIFPLVPYFARHQNWTRANSRAETVPFYLTKHRRSRPARGPPSWRWPHHAVIHGRCRCHHRPGRPLVYFPSPSLSNRSAPAGQLGRRDRRKGHRSSCTCPQAARWLLATPATQQHQGREGRAAR